MCTVRCAVPGDQHTPGDRPHPGVPGQDDCLGGELGASLGNVMTFILDFNFLYSI